jgi:hypothetical protein
MARKQRGGGSGHGCGGQEKEKSESAAPASRTEVSQPPPVESASAATGTKDATAADNDEGDDLQRFVTVQSTCPTTSGGRTRRRWPCPSITLLAARTAVTRKEANEEEEAPTRMMAKWQRVQSLNNGPFNILFCVVSKKKKNTPSIHTYGVEEHRIIFFTKLLNFYYSTAR